MREEVVALDIMRKRAASMDCREGPRAMQCAIAQHASIAKGLNSGVRSDLVWDSRRPAAIQM